MSANREGKNHSTSAHRVWHHRRGLIAETLVVHYWANVVAGPSDCKWIVPGGFDETIGNEEAPFKLCEKCSIPDICMFEKHCDRAYNGYR